MTGRQGLVKHGTWDSQVESYVQIKIGTDFHINTTADNSRSSQPWSLGVGTCCVGDFDNLGCQVGEIS